MTNDLISRKAAMKFTTPEDWGTPDEKWRPESEYGKFIEALPPAQQWNVIAKRPMDAEERKEVSESFGYDIEYEEAYIYSNLPDDGEEVIICFSWGYITTDTFRIEEGCYFEDYGDIDGVVAWMPLPEPYKEENYNE